ncbi:MAG TPA: TetR/AcrR family transcriptional regulator [Gemmatimonadaceae bacterium]|jgi:AcrR family transcriptional regulator|nr:TetR/AcrR family transcriptional regulator [Gemmatimonadaceae bacterium]
MATRKAQLLSAAVDYFVAHGVADLSLRPMAATLGTSARLLIFHFGSKEHLILEVLGEIQRRLQASFQGLVETRSPIKSYWLWATRAENLPSLRLLYEVQIIAIQNPRVYGRYLEQHATDWLAIAEAAMSKSLRSRTMATLCIAVFDGLFLELLSTGDRARTTRALDRFVEIARASAGSGRAARTGRGRARPSDRARRPAGSRRAR